MLSDTVGKHFCMFQTSADENYRLTFNDVNFKITCNHAVVSVLMSMVGLLGISLVSLF